MATYQSKSPAPESEVLRHRLEEGSLALRAVAAILRSLEESCESHSDLNLPIFFQDTAVTLGLLARDVEPAADTMGDAEGFLNRKAVA
jgi:hypothetical protein